MKRRPEPELMDSEAQALAYAEADFNDSNSLFTERFLARFGDRPASGRMADLGCGPGDITIRLARALPGWQLTGLDAGPNMLKHAERRLEVEALSPRVRFRLAHLPDRSLPAAAWNAIVSNSLLHHLHDPQVLWRSVRAMGRPGAAVLVMDLFRPPSLQLAEDIVATYAAGEPEVLRRDFHNSLLAAFEPGEVRAQLAASGLGELEVRTVSDRHLLVVGHLPG